jgi:hypothetical protein
MKALPKVLCIRKAGLLVREGVKVRNSELEQARHTKINKATASVLGEAKFQEANTVNGRRHGDWAATTGNFYADRKRAKRSPSPTIVLRRAPSPVILDPSLLFSQILNSHPIQPAQTQTRLQPTQSLTSTFYTHTTRKYGAWKMGYVMFLECGRAGSPHIATPQVHTC